MSPLILFFFFLFRPSGNQENKVLRNFFLLREKYFSLVLVVQGPLLIIVDNQH